MRGSKRNLISTILSVVLLGGAVLIYMITGLFNLIKMSGIIPFKEAGLFMESGQYVEKTFDYVSGPSIWVSHSLNGVIPIGKEYYYEAVDEEEKVIYIVRAGKSLAYRSEVINGEPLTIKGKVRTTETDTSRALLDTVEAYEANGYSRSSGLNNVNLIFIDNTVTFQSLLRIFGGILIIAGGLFFVLNPNVRNKPVNSYTGVEKFFATIAVLPILIGLFIFLYTISFI
ncbi:MAG: hypothetical protein J5856_01735 [Lachnospiraceae bacterium]|nr:hypothetical protein [Lachnospiraceae bacterium]